jgi:hypothetical protein
MKKVIFNLLPAIFLWLGSYCTATAQAPPVAQWDQITQNGQVLQDDSSSSGTFESISVDASSTSGVKLQFPTTMASKPVSIEGLDGGTLSSTPPTIDTDGSLSFSFQVNDQPGVYRVIVIDPNPDEDSPHIIALVQLEVPSPAD